MKKILTLALTVLMAVVVAPGATAGKKPRQTVEGTIAAPAPYTDDSGCFAGLHRRGAILTQGQNNGAVGWSFDVDPKTWKRPFKLDVVGAAAGTADIDITFYFSDFGTPDVVVSDPANAGSPSTYAYQTRAAGGEAGKVPDQAKHVIVCAYGGGQGASAGVDFSYNAF